MQEPAYNWAQSREIASLQSLSQMGLQSVLSHIKSKAAVPEQPAISGDSPSKRVVYRNRFHFGPNLGALFVQEKWIDNSLFTDKAKGDSELAALAGSKKSGMKKSEMKERWESKFKSFMTDDDWKWLKDRGVTTVRLPIGHWNVGNGQFVKGTEFEKYAEVYNGSWDAIRSLIEAAAKYDIGVLVDLHGVPGGANNDAHSGTNEGKAGFFDHSSYRKLAVQAVEFIAKDLNHYDNLVGVEVINEPLAGQSKLFDYYIEAQRAIRAVAPDLPVVISDAWDLKYWRDTVKKIDSSLSSKGPETAGFVIDTHVYRTFSSEDCAKSANDHVDSALHGVPGDDDVDTLTGEFSCCLSEDSWKKCSGDRGELEAKYGSNQLNCFLFNTRSGAFFWTYKFVQGSGGSWDFRAMSDRNAFRWPQQIPNHNLEEKLGQKLDAHKNYWTGVDKAKDWEFWRYEEGFKRGFSDAKKFSEFNGSRVGRVHALKTARLADHIKAKGSSEMNWGFNQGYVQGIDAFWE